MSPPLLRLPSLPSPAAIVPATSLKPSGLLTRSASSPLLNVNGSVNSPQLAEARANDKDHDGAGDLRRGSMKLDHSSAGSGERRRREDERGDMKGDGTQREKLGFLEQVELWL